MREKLRNFVQNNQKANFREIEKKFVKESRDLIKDSKLPQSFDFYKNVFRKAYELITQKDQSLRENSQNLLLTRYVDFMEGVAGDFFTSETLSLAKKKVKFAELKKFYPIGLPGMVKGHPDFQKVSTSLEIEVPEGYKKVLVANSEPIGPEHLVKCYLREYKNSEKLV